MIVASRRTSALNLGQGCVDVLLGFAETRCSGSVPLWST
jgi:hypothetical protein